MSVSSRGSGTVITGAPRLGTEQHLGSSFRHTGSQKAKSAEEIAADVKQSTDEYVKRAKIRTLQYMQAKAEGTQLKDFVKDL